MRVCIDISAITSQAAGISRYVANLTQHLVEANPDDEFRLVSFYGDNETHLRDFKNAKNVKIDMRRYHGRLFRINLLMRSFLGLPYKNLPEADVYHFPDHVFPADSTKACVITIHDLSFEMFPRDFTWINRTYMKRIIRRSARNAKRVIAVSQSTADDIVKIYGISKDKIMVIHNGLEAKFSEQPKKDDAQMIQSLGIRKPYILSVGTVEPRKNFTRLAEAFVKLKKEPQIPHTLLICGGRGWKDSQILRNLGQFVQFPGYLEDETLRAVYRNADLFAYPSLYEGFGLPILEAMASGIPVVTSNVSSMPEVAGDAAILTDPLSVESIADGLERGLLDDSLRVKLIEAGLERAKEFSWTETARKTRDLYEKVMHP